VAVPSTTFSGVGVNISGVGVETATFWVGED